MTHIFFKDALDIVLRFDEREFIEQKCVKIKNVKCGAGGENGSKPHMTLQHKLEFIKR